MNLTIVIVIAVLIALAAWVYTKIRAWIAAEKIDVEIRRQLDTAIYRVDTKILDKLRQKYSAEQLARVQMSIDNALADIKNKRHKQELNEQSMMRNYEDYVACNEAFNKCLFGAGLPKKWLEATRYTRQDRDYSQDFKEEFRKLLRQVAAEVEKLAESLYSTLLEEAREGNQVSFYRLATLIDDNQYKLVRPDDWVNLVGMHVDCPELSHYGIVGSRMAPSEGQLRLDALKAIQDGDSISAKLYLAYVNSTRITPWLTLEEALRVQLGQIVVNFNLSKATNN